MYEKISTFVLKCISVFLVLFVPIEIWSAITGTIARYPIQVVTYFFFWLCSLYIFAAVFDVRWVYDRTIAKYGHRFNKWVKWVMWTCIAIDILCIIYRSIR